ncbi:ferric iron reductase protein FhuF [Pseudogulbenkiania subflava DSM 22618]|uniref:Ferric iron reductase protein FhuF n=1 Tax=Pseudogulbenkiania subflava DSM 22618 TaxID=1123014 RepID=A0A1Y6C7F2_9NEIS|nr:ferric iron reductase protein FhuF [Pseudogulbenkiania subflava DSM 22618]
MNSTEKPLSRCFAELAPPAYAPYCRHLHLGLPEDVSGIAVRASRLAEHRDVLLSALRRHHGGGSDQALLSQWCGRYLNLLLPPALVAARVLRRPLRMALADCTLLLRDGLPQALCLPCEALGDETDAPAERYRSLCVDHLLPFIDMMAASVSLSPRVLWSTVGNSLEYALSTGFASEEARADADYLFGQRSFFDTGLANPLYRVVHYHAFPPAPLSSPLRLRRLCCLRDRLPGERVLCSSCPKLLQLDEGALVEQLLLRKTAFGG